MTIIAPPAHSLFVFVGSVRCVSGTASVLNPVFFRAETDDFRVTVGTPAKDTASAFTYRALPVKGHSQGQITLTITLTDTEGNAFTLSIPPIFPGFMRILSTPAAAHSSATL